MKQALLALYRSVLKQNDVGTSSKHPLGANFVWPVSMKAILALWCPRLAKLPSAKTGNMWCMRFYFVWRSCRLSVPNAALLYQNSPGNDATLKWLHWLICHNAFTHSVTRRKHVWHQVSQEIYLFTNPFSMDTKILKASWYLEIN